MAITIPSGCWVQKDVNKGSDDESNKTLAYPIKGGYSSLETLMLSLTQTTVVISGWIAKNWNLQRLPGSSGLLTINCVPDDMVPTPTEEDPDAKTQEPLKDIWSIKSVRNDVSIMAYCGVSPGANPQREQIEAWMKEPDGGLAANDSYRKDDGTVFAIGSDMQPTKDLMAKIRKGIESVIRFYPVITRKRTYSVVPPACLENLSYIDTPPVPAAATNANGTVKVPGGLLIAVSAHQWLKVQDDADEQSDGKWTRTESWMGIAISDSENLPWDANLYGANRWDMPYQST
jgi:hypothetical protein